MEEDVKARVSKVASQTNAGSNPAWNKIRESRPLLLEFLLKFVNPIVHKFLHSLVCLNQLYINELSQ